MRLEMEKDRNSKIVEDNDPYFPGMEDPDDEVLLGQYLVEQDPKFGNMFVLTNRVKKEVTKITLTQQGTFEGHPKIFDHFIKTFNSQ